MIKRMTDDACSVGLNPERLTRIQPGMERWVKEGVIAGADMLLARQGRIVYRAQVGMQDKEAGIPMPDNAIFRIYSMTKPIICTALMTFYEEGRFLLHTPVAALLPAFADLKVLETEADGTQKLVEPVRPPTVADLMSHTAGFTYDFLVDSPVGERYRQNQLLNNDLQTLAEMMESLSQLPLAFHPGSRFHYSVSIDVAAYLIQVLADRPLRDVLHERLFAPLGMVDTDFGVTAAQRTRLAAMYGVGDIAASGMTNVQMEAAWRAGVRQRLDVADTYPCDQPDVFVRGGHGLFSTTADYARFALMLGNGGELDGVRVIGRKTLELMHANRLPAALLPWEVSGQPRPGYGYGLGSRVLMDPGAAGVMGSPGEFGWSGAASTYYWVDPREEFVGVFMTQYQGMDEPDAYFRALAYQAIE
ncbi:MAG: beta-lactamase family protein [Caldilineaceae bacterium]|nr:beta-lactamase family protein [Caldilineaceae bacterium]